MPLDPEFIADCLYGPEAQLIDEVVSVDKEASRVVVRMPTHEKLPLTEHQRVHPTRHPRHVSGGLMVHMTGVVGFAHAFYVWDLRAKDGWTGYGVRIYSARFHNLAVPGEPLFLDCKCVHARKGEKQILGRYEIEFRQKDKLVYQGDQVALWTRYALD